MQRVVERIYQHFGLSLSTAARQAMIAWISANPQHKRGRHESTPKQFGLSESAIRERFADYMKRDQCARKRHANRPGDNMAKVALVTGTSRGIGTCGALALANKRGIRAYNLDPGLVMTEAMKISGMEALFAGRMFWAPPEVPGAVIGWLASAPEAVQLAGTRIEAQPLCAKLKLVAGFELPEGKD